VLRAVAGGVREASAAMKAAGPKGDILGEGESTSDLERLLTISSIKGLEDEHISHTSIIWSFKYVQAPHAHCFIFGSANFGTAAIFKFEIC
jgi:hypothetical protein